MITDQLFQYYSNIVTDKIMSFSVSINVVGRRADTLIHRQAQVLSGLTMTLIMTLNLAHLR